MIRLSRFRPLSRSWAGAALLTLVLLSALVLEFVRLPDASSRLNRLPAFGPGYLTRDVALSSGDRQVFGKAHVLRREILSTDDPPFRAVLTIIDGTEDRHAVHDPNYCIRGAGWEEDTSPPSPSRISARSDMYLARLHRGNERREILYFFANGKARYTSPMRYWWETTLRRLTFGATGAEPVLVLLEIDPARTSGRRMDSILPTVEPMIAAL